MLIKKKNKQKNPVDLTLLEWAEFIQNQQAQIHRQVDEWWV